MKKGFKDTGSPIPEITTLNKRNPRGHSPMRNDTAVLRARLERSRAALAESTRALTMSSQRASELQNRLATLEEANSCLRIRLTEVEREAVTANYLANHDALTGLPNRRLLLDRLRQAIAQASRQKKRVALVFFDVDGFKVINDRLGHINGDKILQAVALRLSVCLRAADTACRYGGDEFIVLLPEVDGEQSAAAVEQKIRTQLAAPYLVDGDMISVRLSLGTAIYPVDASDHRELIKLADAAMYNMKTGGAVASDAEVPAVQQLARRSSGGLQ